MVIFNGLVPVTLTWTPKHWIRKLWKFILKTDI